MRALVAGSFSPSLSPPLCLRFGNGDVLPRGEEERWTTTVKSRKSLPNHWAKFTSSHNHLSSTKRVAIFLDSTVAFLPLPSPHPYHLFKLISCHFCPPPSLYGGCPGSFCICSLWDKKNNPEPWNQLDPTYQYKVTHSQSKVCWSQTRLAGKMAPCQRVTENLTVVASLDGTAQPKRCQRNIPGFLYI